MLVALVHRHAFEFVELSQKGSLYIDETPDLMISDFEQRVARAVQAKKIEWFALDYLQILDTHADKHLKFYNATEAVTYASSVCRRVCRKYGVIGLVVSSAAIFMVPVVGVSSVLFF